VAFIADGNAVIETRNGCAQVIPEGAGRVNPRVVTGFTPIPGSVQTNAGKGSGSRLDRRSTRAAGLALTPAPIGAESSRRERWL
jgi:hypothetical protein